MSFSRRVLSHLEASAAPGAGSRSASGILAWYVAHVSVMSRSWRTYNPNLRTTEHRSNTMKQLGLEESSRQKLTLVRIILEIVDHDLVKQLSAKPSGPIVWGRKDWRTEFLNCSNSSSRPCLRCWEIQICPQMDLARRKPCTSGRDGYHTYRVNVGSVECLVFPLDPTGESSRLDRLNPTDHSSSCMIVFPNVLEAGDQLKFNPHIYHVDLCRVVLFFVLWTSNTLRTLNTKLDPLIKALLLSIKDSRDDSVHSEGSAKDFQQLRGKYNDLTKARAPWVARQRHDMLLLGCESSRSLSTDDLLMHRGW